MALPTNADVIVVHGYWLDELTGLGVKQANGLPATIMFDPVPLLGANAAKTPNLRDLTSNAHLKTRTRVASVDPVTGYYAAQLVASNDPDLDAYSGRKVTFLGEDPFTIEVPYNAPTVTVSAEMAAKTGLTQGSSVKAIWLPNASVTTIPTPTPPNNYLSSSQTLANIAAGIETHDEDSAAHADIRALIPAAYTDEQARDALAAALVAGSNVTITPNDAGDTITITATGGGSSYTDEQAQDVIAALFAAGTHSGISFAYNDAGNAISATVSAQAWSQITGKPTFAAVATSGSASDITTGTLPDAVIPSGIARDTEVATAVADLVNSAPGTLDTLGEIATALQADESAAAALTTTVGQKVAKDTIAVNVKDHGVIGDGTTNDTAAIQALIDSASTAGGGTLHFPAGVYRIGGLVLKSGVILGSQRAHHGEVYRNFGQVLFSAYGTPTWMVDTPTAQQTSCGVAGIDFVGNQSATTGGGGIRFQNVDYAVVRDAHIHGFKEQGILQSAGQAAQIDNVLITGCLLNVSRAADAGALEVRGDDAMIRATEAGCSQSALTSSSLYNNAILLAGGNNFLVQCVGEYADVGVKATGWTPRASATRADRNFGPGFSVTSTSYGGVFAGCTSHINTQSGAGNYPAWLVASKSTAFAGCSAPVDAGQPLYSYGFQDNTAWTGVDRNSYAACTGQYATALFSDSGKVAPTRAETVTERTAAITVAGTRNQLGPRFAFFGDSISNYNETYGYYAAWYSGGRIEPVVIASNPGHNSTQLAGEISQVTASAENPAVCVVLAGSNDASQSVTLATYSANIISMVAALRSAGITPVLATVPPRNSYSANVATYNAWLARYANLNAIPLLDFFSQLVDPATGNYLTAYWAGDGIHPNADGNRLLGKETADVLAPQVQADPLLVLPYSGAPNLFSNSQFLTGTTTPTGYGAFSGTGVTPSLVTDSAGFKWYRATLSGASGQATGLGFEVDAGSSTFAVGDRVRLSCRLRLNQDVGPGSVGNGLYARVDCYSAGFGSATGQVNLTSPSAGWGAFTRQGEGVMVRELVVPANTAILYFQVGAGPADGTYDYAQPTLLNLTKLGIA